MYVQNNIVDSNGAAWHYPGIAYGDSPSMVSFETGCMTAFTAHDQSVKPLRGPYYTITGATTCIPVIQFVGASGNVTDPLVAHPGDVFHLPDATGYRVLAHVRAGILSICGGASPITSAEISGPRNPRQVTVSQTVLWLASSAVASNTWTLNGDAANPAFGFGGDIAYCNLGMTYSVTSSHWHTLMLVALGRDRNGALTNRRPICNLVNGAVAPITVHPHDELGVYAVPTATNPSPGTPPLGGIIALDLTIARAYVRNLPVDAFNRLV